MNVCSDSMKNKNILLLVILSFLIAFSLNGIYAVDAEDIGNLSSDLSSCNQDIAVSDSDVASSLNDEGALYSVDECALLDSVDEDALCDSLDDSLDSYDTIDCDSLGASCSDDILKETASPNLPNIDNGTVSGGVDVVAEHPWGPIDKTNGNKGNINYLIPSKAEDIRFAYVFVNIYSGSAQPTYGSIAYINITTDYGVYSYTENLWVGSGTTNGVIYTVNDHVNKCYSDYMISYNITELVQGLRDSSISVDVLSYPMADKEFDGRIKLISLILGYDDGDSDEIHYWLNAGQSWTDSMTYTEFGTASKITGGFYEANLTNIALSGSDGTYFLNNKVLYTDENGGDVYQSGSYYQFHKWDVSDRITSGENSTVKYIASADGYGSFKNIISLLTAKDIGNLDAHISFETEYENTCYAGCENVLNITVNTNLKGKYAIRLLDNGIVLKSFNLTLGKGTTSFLLTDSTIRAIDESTVLGKDSNNVNYTVELLFNENEIDSYSIIAPILYNGYLGKDYAYNASGPEAFLNITISGDIVIDMQNASTYLDSSQSNREDIWNVNLPSGSSFARAFVYVPYSSFDSSLIGEDLNMFDAAFNGVGLNAMCLYRDQSNLGFNGSYGYGLLVYDVTGLIRAGANSFSISKRANTPNVYPSTLVYLYNSSKSGVLKDVYIVGGADLLSSSYDLADRQASADSSIGVSLANITDASLYVFAAGGESGEANILFNGKAYSNVYNGSSSSSNLYALNVKDSIQASNSISLISTGSEILALQQIIVISRPDGSSQPANSSNGSQQVPANNSNGSQQAPAKPSSAKASANVIAYSLNTTYNSLKAFTVKVLGAGNKPLGGIKLTLRIYTGSKYVTRYITTNSLGIAKFTGASTLSIGSHKVAISSSNTKYAISKSSLIKVLKAGTIVKAKKFTAKYKKSAYFKVTVKNKATKKIVKGIKIRVKVYTGKKFKAYIIKTNSKGIAKLNTKKLKKGTHKVVISSKDSRYVIKKSSKIIIKR